MATESDVLEGFLLKLQAFLDLAENSSLEAAWPDLDYTPDINTPYVQPKLFIDAVQRAGVGVPGVRRHTGRFQVNVHHKTGAGPKPIVQIAERLLDYFEPTTISPIVEGSTTVHIGDPNGQNSLPWTREAITSDPWQTKPVIIPWWVDFLPT